MVYRVSDVTLAEFPSAGHVDQALAEFGVTANDIRSAILGFTCQEDLRVGEGYQQHLAHHLEHHLGAFLRTKPGVSATSSRYSDSLGEKADLAILGRSGGGLYVEIEFRPNVEKDLAKFQIGHHSGRLSVGILVLAINRANVNPGYTTMPEFAKFVRVIPEFRPLHPLLLIGIDGRHVTVDGTT
jgi:hypothetical protein